jgi:hypothetical protein
MLFCATAMATRKLFSTNYSLEVHLEAQILPMMKHLLVSWLRKNVEVEDDELLQPGVASVPPRQHPLLRPLLRNPRDVALPRSFLQISCVFQELQFRLVVRRSMRMRL